MDKFKSLLNNIIDVLLLTLGVAFISYGTHTSEWFYSAIGGACLGIYELKNN